MNNRFDQMVQVANNYLDEKIDAAQFRTIMIEALIDADDGILIEVAQQLVMNQHGDDYWLRHTKDVKK